MAPGTNIQNLFLRISIYADEAALWELHSVYYERLLRFVLVYVSPREAAEEVVNDVFVYLWQKKHLLKDVVTPEVYLFVCAKNKAYRYCRDQKLPEMSIDEINDFELVVRKTPEDILISSEMVKLINNAIQQLPPKCKMIFLLVKENCLKYREVADLLDISPKTVENQMSIALKKLSEVNPLLFMSVN